MKQTIVILASVFLLFTASLQSVAAYTTTGQYATKITNQTGLYLIEFTFGHGDHDVYIPVIARSSDKLDRGSLSYRVMDDEGEIVRGIEAGIVLSDVPVIDGMYVVPKGLSATFTLMVLFSPADDEVGTEFWTEVTALPFSFDGTKDLQLNPSELQYYKTPALTFSQIPLRVSSVDIYYKPLNNGSQQHSLSSNTAGVSIHQTDD